MRFLESRALRIAAFGLALVACNADRIVAPIIRAPSAISGDLATDGVPKLVITEFMADPAVVADASGEWFELYNGESVAVSLAGYTIRSNNAVETFTISALTIPAKSCVVLGPNDNTATNGGVPIAYKTPAAFNLANGSKVETIDLHMPDGTRVDQVTYTVNDAASTNLSVSPGVSWELTNVNLDNTYVQNNSAWAKSTAPTILPPGTANGERGTPGRCPSDVPAGEVASVKVNPPTASVTKGGTQPFTATAYDAQNNPLPNVSFEWSSVSTAVATVDKSTGVATAVDIGTTDIIAKAGGQSGSASMTVTAPLPPPTLQPIRFSEIHYDNGGADVGERIEVEGPAGASIEGWSIVLYDGGNAAPYNTTLLHGTFAASCSDRGALYFDFAQIQNGAPDGMALVDAAGTVVEFLSYEGTFTGIGGPANGTLSKDILAFEPGNGPSSGSIKRDASNVWTVDAKNDFGSVNSTVPGCGGPTIPTKAITFTGRDPVADPPLPIGFEDQLFPTLLTDGVVTSTTFTWKSETPDIASIDEFGVMHALAAGTAILRATAADGTTATYSLPTVVPTRSTTSVYGGNTEFGVPTDADGSDDFIVARTEYTTSYNKNRGTPNWVSYRIDKTNNGPLDRCDCFTHDPELPTDYPHISTSDYTGSAAINGFGIDRGHLARSADRTGGSLDNAATFYFSNIVPQASYLNQHAWATMENDLGAFARVQHKEVYVIAGAVGSKGTLKNLGKITIPATLWKVAIVMPEGRGLADVHTASDIDSVIAVIVPNDSVQGYKDWKDWATTVGAVQTLSGYDLLSLLPDNVECAVEKSNCAPAAAISGDKTGVEGGTLTFNANGSSDPDAGDVLTYTWTFGDGGTATGLNVSHTFNVDQGNYPVTVTVNDGHGHSSTATMTVSIANANPTATLASVAAVVEGSNFTLTLSNATDPSPADASSLRYEFDCGDGQGYQQSAAATFSCATNDNGTRAVQAKVIDKDGGFSNYSGTVSVENAPPVITSFTTPAGPMSTGAPVTATVNFTDVGSADTHTAVIAWGDGQTSTVTGSAGQASATHTYAATDFYTITVTVTDDDGGSATRASSVLVVYDASAGFVTGGGYVRGADGGKGGDKTHFNLDARYAGGSTPNVRFDLRTSEGLTVNGGAFDYLVVRGVTATVRGTGTLADGTAVGILVSVRDGKLAGDRIDRVRIKVWNSTSNEVLFDTQAGVAELAPPATIVDGGNITIHR